MEQFGINQNLPWINSCAACEKEFPQAGQQLQSADKNKIINLSHGDCPRHATERYLQIPGMSVKKIKFIRNKIAQLAATNQMAPDLRQHPELVKLYSQGIFTKEEAEKAKNPQQQPPQSLAEQPVNQSPLQLTPLKERLQKLAGIIKG